MAVTTLPMSAYQQAFYSLLPSGEYWAKDKDDTLDKLLHASAIVLQDFDYSLLERALASIQPVYTQVGHSKIDYQQLLASHNITAQVSDNISGFSLLVGQPIGRRLGQHSNKACILIATDEPVPDAIKQIIEAHKQPHTYLIWRTNV